LRRRPRPSRHWSGGFVSPDGRTLLAQWTAECEVPFAFFAPAKGGKPRLVAGEQKIDDASPSVAHGWTRDSDAIVEVLSGCSERGASEIQLISPAGEKRVLR